MTLNDGDYVSIDLQRFIDRYRLPGECDECATNTAALATGYPDHVPEACSTEGCRNYDAAYAAHLAEIDAPWVALEEPRRQIKER
jgi:hypothetical protein